ncbi:hypothetical protein [Mycobacterium paraseoulense]|uniref:Uncharacterized protein n=1 Tax=Mycobacterium paraseoulense TaxID=590652 RepID=A0A1X0IAL2_9MYCO|nr:hypothetical protein [Mycobacterium paraseoulense]MCV7397969.1 hypothetical protein [Mycobacterium paraseoulense]ORB41041.1 hypothetical protein BST39_12580 [Mycobacterium paraseoulense]BBZ70294.1 hypothetical protein MPRS_13870 [Mycobacterium paraseoulense]
MDVLIRRFGRILAARLGAIRAAHIHVWPGKYAITRIDIDRALFDHPQETSRFGAEVWWNDSITGEHAADTDEPAEEHRDTFLLSFRRVASRAGEILLRLLAAVVERARLDEFIDTSEDRLDTADDQGDQNASDALNGSRH